MRKAAVTGRTSRLPWQGPGPWQVQVPDDRIAARRGRLGSKKSGRPGGSLSGPPQRPRRPQGAPWKAPEKPAGERNDIMEPIIGGPGGGGLGSAAQADADVIKDSSQQTFMQDVIETSMTVPVVVDF